MKTMKPILLLCSVLCFAASCKKEVDMTLMQKTVLENADIQQIKVSDAWEVTIVADSNTYVELEYSAYLEEHLSVNEANNLLTISFKDKVYPEMGSVYKAKVHTSQIGRIEVSEASEMVFEGEFTSPSDTLNIEVKDGSRCSGLNISCKYSVITINDGSKWVGFQISGTNHEVTVDNASFCKGGFETRFHFVASLRDDSQLITFGGTAPYGMIRLQNNCLLNMAQTEIEELHVDLSGVSEATVNVANQMTGVLTEASTLYYLGQAQIDVECSDDSQLIPL